MNNNYINFNHLRNSMMLALFVFCSALFAQTTQIIHFPDIPVLGYGDVSYTLNATANSGLPVRYTSTDVNVATISGNVVTIKKAGFTVIRAFQDGNASYAVAQPAAQLMVITPKATLVVQANNITIQQGTSTPAFTYNISGFKRNETLSVVSGAPAFAPLANSLSAGTYPIVINKATLAATNYDFDMQDAVLTVNGLTSSFSNVLDGYGDIKIFPNPVVDYCVVQNAQKVQQIAVYDIRGKLLKNKTNLNTAQHSISFAAFPKGLYVIQLQLVDGVSLRKIVSK